MGQYSNLAKNDRKNPAFEFFSAIFHKIKILSYSGYNYSLYYYTVDVIQYIVYLFTSRSPLNLLTISFMLSISAFRLHNTSHDTIFVAILNTTKQQICFSNCCSVCGC